MKNRHKHLLKQTTLLLVEDNTITRESMKAFFSIYVDEIFEESNGIDALNSFRKNNQTIIITDLSMPDMNGLELTKEIRCLNNKVPLVIISAFSDESMLLEFMSLHLIQYIVKPFSIDILKNLLYKFANIIDVNELIESQLSIDSYYSFTRKCIICKKEIINLSFNESSLLELFINNKNKLLTKDEIEHHVYDLNLAPYALPNLIFRLREKLENKDMITTISSKGFIFNC